MTELIEAAEFVVRQVEAAVQEFMADGRPRSTQEMGIALKALRVDCWRLERAIKAARGNEAEPEAEPVETPENFLLRHGWRIDETRTFYRWMREGQTGGITLEMAVDRQAELNKIRGEN